VALIEELRNRTELKFSFGKNDEFFLSFSRQAQSACMHDEGFGLGLSNLSPENKLWGVFNTINRENGLFIFNINGVDIEKAVAGFQNYEMAESNNMITEWELSIILQNRDYLEKTIFHNGKTKFEHNETGLELIWN
jgi:hypothetical protein